MAHLVSLHPYPELAHDAIQEVSYAFVLKTRTGNWKGTIGNLPGYFKTSCRYRMKVLLKKKNKLLLVPDHGLEKLPIYDQICLEEEIKYVKRELIVKRNLERVSEKCKELLIQFYFEQLTNADIATLANIPANNVRVTKHRCLERYKRILQKNEQEEDYLIRTDE